MCLLLGVAVCLKFLWYVCKGIQGSTGTKENTSVNPILGIHDGDIMASIKDPHIKEIVAKESLQYKPNPKGGEGPEVSEENKKALSNLLEVRFLMWHVVWNRSNITLYKVLLDIKILFSVTGWPFSVSQVW